ncbi:MAG: PmoA family protein, partial [Myxococcales bacterium]|nr:PmoA family protein [Myxococcales bacterium]
MSYEIVHDNARLWVTRDGALLGGYAANKLRAYAFPFFSPNGALVLQEAPPDHPHHQGIWAGLDVDGHDLWNAGSFDVPRNRQELVVPLREIETACSETGARLTHEVRWVSVDGADLLRERREVVFRAAP